jgi:hypothetical protein
LLDCQPAALVFLALLLILLLLLIILSSLLPSRGDIAVRGWS